MDSIYCKVTEAAMPEPEEPETTIFDDEDD